MSGIFSSRSLGQLPFSVRNYVSEVASEKRVNKLKAERDEDFSMPKIDSYY